MVSLMSTFLRLASGSPSVLAVLLSAVLMTLSFSLKNDLESKRYNAFHSCYSHYFCDIS